MTREEAINVLNILKNYYNDKDVSDDIGYVGFDDEDNEAIDMAIETLKGQDSVLNKIKEEIQDNTYFINETTGKEGVDFETVEKIIDKYKAKSEDMKNA